ncbi:MAG: class I SAM-dependent methyltransferase [Acidimicrobiia bacterium]
MSGTRRVPRQFRVAAVWMRSILLMPLRRSAAYGSFRGILRLMPSSVRRYLDLDVRTAEPLRVELGGGPFPSDGYVHVDTDWRARHLEYRAPVWRLPFGDGTVEEILAIHVLEHVHPGRLADTLREWRRVLRPGGVARIHVPNAPAVFRAFESASSAHKWALTNALLGMWGGPAMAEPSDFDVRLNRPDHQAIYDFSLLEEQLILAGFDVVINRTGEIRDRHSEAWDPIVRDYSLVVVARTPDLRLASPATA